MASFKEPGFQERVAAAARAREAALAKLKAKPPVDESVLAARAARNEAREAAAAEKRRAAQAAREAAEAAKRAAVAEAAEKAEAAARQAVLSEAEKKAARDARYAARKSRK